MEELLTYDHLNPPELREAPYLEQLPPEEALYANEAFQEIVEAIERNAPGDPEPTEIMCKVNGVGDGSGWKFRK